MEISIEKIKELRELTGVGIMDCKKALVDCEGDFDAAIAKLQEHGAALAEKKKDRAIECGLVESYIHAGGRVGAIVEVNCETDFVAKTEKFKNLVHDIAMQVAAMAPRCVSADEVADDETPEEACLLLQPFIKDPQKNIQSIIVETIAQVGENIRLNRFARFELGS